MYKIAKRWPESYPVYKNRNVVEFGEVRELFEMERK